MLPLKSTKKAGAPNEPGLILEKGTLVLDPGGTRTHGRVWTHPPWWAAGRGSRAAIQPHTLARNFENQAPPKPNIASLTCLIRSERHHSSQLVKFIFVGDQFPIQHELLIIGTGLTLPSAFLDSSSRRA